MKTSFALAGALLAATSVSGSVIRVRDETVEARTIEVVEATATNLVELAAELSVDLICLTLANPLVSLLTSGQQIVVPIKCCGTSCQGPLCSLRSQCQGKSTASKGTGTATVIIETSTTATSTTPTTTTSSTSSTPTTLVTTTSSTSSTPTSTSTSTSTTPTTTSTSSTTSSTSTTSTTSTSTSSTSTDTTTSPTTTSMSTSTSSTSTSTSTTSTNPPTATAITPGQLPIALVNNVGPNANAYITGQDDNGNLVFVKADGTYYYPTANSATQPQPITEGIAIPLGAKGSTVKITTPGHVISGRIWFADGTLSFSTILDATNKPSLVQPTVSAPNDANVNTNWGFVELTYNTSELYANLSFVDFVGLNVAMQLQSGDGSVQTAKGLPTTAVADLCSDLKTQAGKDGQPWDKLCINGQNGQPLRVLAPADYISGYDGSAFASYWTDYVNAVWSKYAGQPLNFNTQSSAIGTITCNVVGDTLNCGGSDNRNYPKPNALDIFGCNTGPFVVQGADADKAVIARLCAGFDRSTLLLSGGDTQPSLPASSYYTVDPTNYYSKFVHAREIDGKGYAFAYDDVTPDNGPDASGAVRNGNPELLTVFIGGSS